MCGAVRCGDIKSNVQKGTSDGGVVLVPRALQNVTSGPCVNIAHTVSVRAVGYCQSDPNGAVPRTVNIYQIFQKQERATVRVVVVVGTNGLICE